MHLFMKITSNVRHLRLFSYDDQKYFKMEKCMRNKRPKRKTSEHEDRLIKRAAVTDLLVTSRHIKEDLNLSVSLRLLHKLLHYVKS